MEEEKMKVNKKAVCIIVALCLATLVGCGRLDKDKELNEALAVLVENARSVGYLQCYIEILYLRTDHISEENYQKYLKAKNQYEDEKTPENLKFLAKIVQEIMDDIPEDITIKTLK